MSEPIFNADQLRQTHELDKETKTVELHKCWSVVFDVNGNAPENAKVAFFATEALANQALQLFVAKKNDQQTTSIVINGERHTALPTYWVEGYDFDTYYRVDLDWQPAEDILCSLAELATLADEVEATTSTEGVFLDKIEEVDEDE